MPIETPSIEIQLFAPDEVNAARAARLAEAMVCILGAGWCANLHQTKTSQIMVSVALVNR